MARLDDCGLLALDLRVQSLLDDIDVDPPRESPHSVVLEMLIEEVDFPDYNATRRGWDAWIETFGPMVVKYLDPLAKGVRLTIEDLDPDENGQAGRSFERSVTLLPVRVMQCES